MRHVRTSCRYLSQCNVLSKQLSARREPALTTFVHEGFGRVTFAAMGCSARGAVPCSTTLHSSSLESHDPQSVQSSPSSFYRDGLKMTLKGIHLPGSWEIPTHLQTCASLKDRLGSRPTTSRRFVQVSHRKLKSTMNNNTNSDRTWEVSVTREELVDVCQCCPRQPYLEARIPDGASCIDTVTLSTLSRDQGTCCTRSTLYPFAHHIYRME